MDILDHAVNKRIMNGSFPTEKLYPADIESKRNIDFDAEAESGLTLFSEVPELLSVLFVNFCNRCAEIDLINRPECYVQEVNYYINARCSEDYLKVNGSLQHAYNLVPIATPLDKALWFGAYAYQMESMLGSNHEYDPKSMMFTWIKLLDMAQALELKTQLTIDVSKVSYSTNLVKLLQDGFLKAEGKGIIRKLSNHEYAELKRVYRERDSLLSEIAEERKQAIKIADITQSEWEIFLNFINDISEKEHSVIRHINESLSAKDKLRTIYQYNYAISRIEKGKYDLDGKEINLLKVFDAVNDRIQNASTYAAAYIEGDEPFRLHPALFVLAMEPMTFNYLFMIFHQFRLDPNKDNAKKFVSLALASVKKNLGGETKNWVSLDDMIQDFYNTVSEYMTANKDYIDKLSFDALLPDAVAVAGTVADSSQSLDLQNDAVIAKMKAIKNSKAYEEEIERIVEGNIRRMGLNEVMNQVKTAESEYTQVEHESVARQLIYSLNIIYLFCDALRIMLSSKRGNIKIKHAEVIRGYRSELLKLDDKLVHKVYAHLGDQEMGMLEYREKTGVISTTLSEQEAEEEHYRNSVFADVLKGAIDSLVVGIEDQNSDQIMKTKARIREEILRFPDCDDKEYYATWLDSVSNRISAALINNCKKQGENFLAIKENIKSALGEASAKLPSSTLDSLTTAEMLYGQYASEDFAEKGFDFSCISALYYQSFEDAYNDLIWHDYATMLNSLVINGQKFTDILDAKRNSRITDRDEQGYLENYNAKQRGYYINYRNAANPQTSVSLRCMYKSFGILMENVRYPSYLNHFCDYFAQKTGYSGRQAMFNDTAFMNRCQDFTNAVLNSADNRNNASHGGTFISVTQCTDDKKTVLNDLEAVRINSIGLIQQLLYLLQ